MNLNKPVATARQLYQLLSEVARSLQNCEPEGDSAVESAITTRVAQEVIAILKENGYPVEVMKVTKSISSEMVHYAGIRYSVRLMMMFNEHDYSSVIEAVQELLTSLSEVEND